MIQSSTKMMPATRELRNASMGVPVTDGDGVEITRVIGTSQLNLLDPFLLFDVFESDQPQDYIGGFPPHPHRGFETVTYLLAGRMRHKDSAGHEGVIEPGGVQWMTAGRGIVHSEMPEQEAGLLQGYQLWVNLPVSKKMLAPAYQEFPADNVPVERLDNGTEIRVIAGVSENGTKGPVANEFVDPVYMDILLPAGQAFEQTVGVNDSVFIFVIEGEISVGESCKTLGARHLGVLHGGDQVVVTANEASRFLLVAAMPLNEPVARGGPFVMNTRAEVLQAFDDFHNGRF